MRVDLIFLGSSSCETEIDDVEFFDLGMGIFDHFDRFVVLDDVFMHEFRVSVNLFHLSDGPELFLSLSSLDVVLGVFELILFIGFKLHGLWYSLINIIQVHIKE